MNDKPVLIISNLEPGDETFDSDVGSWNVSRAVADCKAGKHKLHGFNVKEVYRCNKNVEVDEAKVREFMRSDLTKFPPLIFAGENGMVWLIEGHHRLRALYRRKIRECTGYVIEEADGFRYRIYYNGKRIAPWRASDA